MRKSFFRIDPYLVLLLVLCLWALIPLFAPGYFYDAHDGRHSVFFTSMFNESFQSGAWWPRWAMHHNQGYGYPTFVIQAPGAFYIAELFIQLGAGITNAVKLTFGVGFLASGWGMYALVGHWLAATSTEITDDRANKNDSPDHSPFTIHHSPFTIRISHLAALIAALLYVYAPYHLLDSYVRAALAETMLFAWLPWVFLAFDRLIAGGKDKGWQGRLLLAASSFAGLLLTHVFALLSVTPLLAGFILFRLWQQWRAGERFVVRTVLAAAGGIGALLLSAIFVLPLLAEGPLLAQEVFTTGTYSYELHWVQWGQFLSSFWGYGYSDDPIGANDGMSFQLGAMLVMLAIFALPVLFSRRLPNRMRWLLAFLWISSLVVLFVMTPAAASLWKLLPMLAVIQFPWRLLLLACFLLSAVGGLSISAIIQLTQRFGEETEIASTIGIALLIIFASSSYVEAKSLQAIEPWREDGRAVFQFENEHPDMLGYTLEVEDRFTTSPMSEQYAAADFSNDKLQRLGILQGNGRVTVNYSRGQSFGGEVEMQSAGVAQIRVYDFPGWQISLDGIPVSHRVSPPYGLIEIDVPVGHHQIDMVMGSTPVRSLGILISGGALALLLGLWILGRATSTDGRK